MLEVYDESSRLQFNAQTYAYYMSEKGVANTLHSDPLGISLDIVTFTLSQPAELVFLSCAAENVSLTPADDTNSETAYKYFLGDAPAGTSNPVNWWAFRSMRHLAASAHMDGGLEMYDASGNVCYTTNHNKILRVISVLPCSDFAATGWSKTLNLPSGRVYGHALYGTVYQKVGSNFMTPMIRNVSATQMSVVPSINRNVTYPGTLVRDGGILTADLTGF